jgi:hypothetical protein
LVSPFKGVSPISHVAVESETRLAIGRGWGEIGMNCGGLRFSDFLESQIISLLKIVRRNKDCHAMFVLTPEKSLKAAQK